MSFSTIAFEIINLTAIEIIEITADDNDAASIVITELDCPFTPSDQTNIVHRRPDSILFSLMSAPYEPGLQKQILPEVSYMNYTDTVQSLNLARIIYKTRVIIKTLRYIAE